LRPDLRSHGGHDTEVARPPPHRGTAVTKFSLYVQSSCDSKVLVQWRHFSELSNFDLLGDYLGKSIEDICNGRNLLSHPILCWLRIRYESIIGNSSHQPNSSADHYSWYEECDHEGPGIEFHESGRHSLEWCCAPDVGCRLEYFG